jgi:hypothetical protein
MLPKKSEQTKPIFRSVATKTFCGDCAHVRGNNSLNLTHWSCAAEKIRSTPFQDDGHGRVIFTDEYDCPLFKEKGEKKSFYSGHGYGSGVQEKISGVILPEKNPA